MAIRFCALGGSDMCSCAPSGLVEGQHCQLDADLALNMGSYAISNFILQMKIFFSFLRFAHCFWFLNDSHHGYDYHLVWDVPVVLDERLGLRLASASLLLLWHTQGCTSEDGGDGDGGDDGDVQGDGGDDGDG